MINLKKQLLLKINKSDHTGISMRLRLFLFLLLLIFTMVAGIISILLVTGTFTAGINDSEKIVKGELTHISQEISAQYGQLSLQAVEFSSELTLKIEEELSRRKLSFSDLSDHPDQIEELISTLFERTYYTLQKSSSSGAFFILNTTVNPALENSENSRAGLYLKNLEPNVLSATSPNLTILRGFPSISRANGISLNTQWRMEFDVSEADYFYLPMETAKEHMGLPLNKLYYWSDPMIIPDSSEEVMLCSVPLIDSRNNIYGVCGFEVSTMLFKLSYMPSNQIYTRLFCMLSPFQSSSVAIDRSMFAGGYSVKDFTEENSYLKVKEGNKSFSSYISDNGNIYLGFHTPTLIYPSKSPYPDTSWITAVLVPKEDIVDSITQFNIILTCLLCLLVAIGIIISVVFSNKYLQPISQGIEIIKSAATDEIPITNIPEIDELMHYLALYKKELNKKVENDKYQLSLLEEFLSKTGSLSPAERSVFNLLAKGLTAKEIADELFLSINTIKTHNKRIFSKLGVTSREELLLYVNMLKEIGQELK